VKKNHVKSPIKMNENAKKTKNEYKQENINKSALKKGQTRKMDRKRERERQVETQHKSERRKLNPNLLKPQDGPKNLNYLATFL